MKQLFLSLLVLTAVGISTKSFAQWIHADAPTGGSIGAFAVSGSDIFVGGGNYGPGDVYVSHDEGNRWQPAGAGLPTEGSVLSIAAVGKELFVATSRGLVYSNSSGLNWKLIDTIFGKTTASYVIASDSEVIVASSGLYRSTDHGTKWSSISSGNPNLNRINSIWREGAVLLISTQGHGILRTTDNGVNWTSSAGLGGEDDYTYDIIRHNNAIYVGTLRGVFRSTDLGASWVSTRNGLPMQVGAENFVTDGITLYANLGSYGVWTSTDEGNSWNRLNPDPSDYTTLNGLLLYKGTLFAGVTREGVYKWNPATTKWESSTTGITNVSIKGLKALPNSKGKRDLFAGTLDADFGHMWRSDDKAANWKMLDSSHVRGYHDFAVQGDALLAATDGEGIFRSTDWGATWTAATVANGASYVDCFAMAKDHLLAGAAGFSVNIIRSTDNGKNWTSATTMPVRGVDRLYYDRTTAKAFACMSLGLAISTDDGDTWSTSSQFDLKQVYDVTRSRDYLFLASRTGLFRSSDGVLWDSLPGRFAGQVMTALLTENGILFAATARQVACSTDDGQTWNDFNTLLPDGGNILNLASDGINLYVGLANFGLRSAPLPNQAAVTQSRKVTESEIICKVEGRQLLVSCNPNNSMVESVRILDVNGRGVANWIPNDRSLYPLPHIASGVYFVQIRSHGTVQTFKVLVGN